MRRILLVLSVAALMAAMTLVSIPNVAFAKGPTPNAHNCGNHGPRN
jgi:hypothetical protein